MIKHGDCLELMKEIPTGSVDMVLMDPPYGTTSCPFDKRIPFAPMWQELLRVCKLNAAILLFSQLPFGAELIMSQKKLFRYCWIWEKSLGVGFLNAKKMPLRCHEQILVYYRRLPTYNPQFTKGKPQQKTKPNLPSHNYNEQTNFSYYQDGEHYCPRDVIKFNPVQGHEHPRYHPQQKPVPLLEYLIKTYTNEGETVLDATMGSGSTGVAAVNLNRNFIGIELEKNFYDIAEKRISEALASKAQGLF